MRPRNRKLAELFDERLVAFVAQRRPLPGLLDAVAKRAFLEQILESVRRIEFIRAIRRRPLDPCRTDPSTPLFDPLRAAVLHQRRGNIDEASWLVFLFVHFGKHRRGDWRLVRDVYGRLGNRPTWNWAATSADPEGFREWLDAHQAELTQSGVGFGNHRKYESLRAYSASGTGAVVDSYVQWIAPPRTHSELFGEALQLSANDQRRAFDYLYRSMATVRRFGRLARFDYLTMLGKLDLAPIEPGSAYLTGATGPTKGACLLFGQEAAATELDSWLQELDVYLGVGMQALEDSLCNWQKSPNKFIAFRG